MHRKVLYLSRKAPMLTGGSVCSSRNLKSIKQLFGEENVHIHMFSDEKRRFHLLRKIIEVLTYNIMNVSLCDRRSIEDVIRTENIDLVFLDSSLYGFLAKSLKKQFPDLYIVAFFHNFELKLIRECNRGLKRIFYTAITRSNELWTCKYADKIITLNSRDQQLVYNEYKRFSDINIPISLEDRFVYQASTISSPKILLFVGSYFYPNIHGVQWFMNNVMPNVDAKLIIVGQGMSQLEIPKELKSKVVIHSDVPDLSTYYSCVDFVVLPIFLGSGMKIKTAEALMHGKYLIGTTEAFVGYDINENVAMTCNTASEFIKAITNTYPNKYTDASRHLFLSEYSLDATLSLFVSVLKD